jgi:anti-sigma factor RsiW
MPEQELLHDDVEKQLDPATHAQVEASLSGDDAARAAVAAWQIQNDRLRALQRATLDEPAPLALIAAAAPDSRLSEAESAAAPAPAPPPLSPRLRRGNRSVVLRTIDRILARLAHTIEHGVERLFGTPVEHSLIPQALAIALVLMLGLGTGWFGHRAWADRESPGAPVAVSTETGSGASGSNISAPPSTSPAGVASVAQGLMREAMVAHKIYTADTRRPVEMVASEPDQLLNWLSRHLGRPLQLPALGDLGWNLVGGRLLPGNTDGAGAARAQFMYQDKAGQPLTLYLSVLDPAVAKRKPGSNIGQVTQMTNSSTAFSYISRDTMRSVYWTEGRFGYALVGELPRAALEKIGAEVYLQTVGLSTVEGRH